MKKNYFLRQWAFALVLLLTITITFYSCKKDKHNNLEISGADLMAAKSWLKLNLKTTENNPFKTLSPNWDDVYTDTEDNQSIIEVGLTNPDKIFVGDSPNDYSQPELGLARSNIRLVLFKNIGNNSIVAGCYMVIINNAGTESAKLHYNSTGNLSGKVYYFNTDGSFSNGALYSNGQIVKANGKINSLNQSLLNKKLYSTAVKKLSIGIKDKIIAVKSPCADGVDIPIWVQSCVGVEGYMTCTPYISGFAHLPGSCDGDYGDNGGYAGSHGGYAGNGVTLLLL
ncbi:hypothetical protein [Pedobacter terrae]|uniref:hypothetical protein n=1 Tax=Pedobacter terrae TaxID=405671 RepID=UPI002FFC53A3